MTSPLKPLDQCCSNFIWSLLRLGEQKIAKMVAVHWPRWLPKIAKMVAVHWPRWPPCPYMVKTFKNLLLQNRGCLWHESLHKSSGMGGLPKLLKWWSYIDVWPFLRRGQVCFPMHLYGPYTFVWEKCWEFQTTSPLKPLGQCYSNFMWSLLRLGERKIAKMVTVHWPRWLLCPYMVKIFKNLLLQNQISPGALSLHKSSGTGDLPKLLKWWSYIDIWPFYGKVKFASDAFVWALYIYMGKNVENSYFGHLYNSVQSKLDDEH